MEKLGQPERMAQGEFGEDDLDGGPPGLEDELGDELGEEGDECIECDKGELRELLEAVEMGEMGAEEAFDKLCAGDEEGLEDELGGELGGPMDDLGGGGGMDDLGGGGGGGLGDEFRMESVQRIANLLTEDPDIFSS
jgi:hypothetical protein